MEYRKLSHGNEMIGVLNDEGAFMTGADFPIDGGATAYFFHGPLKLENQR